MANLWNQNDIPHKGWKQLDVIDIRGDGESADETDYETCMMCNNERIRFVHILIHDEVEEQFRVGCVCAEKMTADYLNPKNREKDLKNRFNRRKNWLKKLWKRTQKGNLLMRFPGHHIVIFKVNSGKYKVRIDEQVGTKIYDDIISAKYGAFDGVEFYKKKGKW